MIYEVSFVAKTAHLSFALGKKSSGFFPKRMTAAFVKFPSFESFNFFREFSSPLYSLPASFTKDLTFSSLISSKLASLQMELSHFNWSLFFLSIRFSSSFTLRGLSSSEVRI